MWFLGEDHQGNLVWFQNTYFKVPLWTNPLYTEAWSKMGLPLCSCTTTGKSSVLYYESKVSCRNSLLLYTLNLCMATSIFFFDMNSIRSFVIASHSCKLISTTCSLLYWFLALFIGKPYLQGIQFETDASTLSLWLIKDSPSIVTTVSLASPFLIGLEEIILHFCL